MKIMLIVFVCHVIQVANNVMVHLIIVYLVSVHIITMIIAVPYHVLMVTITQLLISYVILALIPV